MFDLAIKNEEKRVWQTFDSAIENEEKRVWQTFDSAIENEERRGRGETGVNCEKKFLFPNELKKCVFVRKILGFLHFFAEFFKIYFFSVFLIFAFNLIYIFDRLCYNVGCLIMDNCVYP